MQALYETVKSIIDSGRIGVPVFARFLVKIPTDIEKPDKILAKIINMECLWLDSSPDKIYAQYGSNQGHINAILQYKDGKTAIAGVAIIPNTNVTFDLMLLGNKGGIYHDSEVFSIGDEATSVPENFYLTIKRSLETGKPEEVKGNG